MSHCVLRNWPVGYSWGPCPCVLGDRGQGRMTPQFRDKDTLETRAHLVLEGVLLCGGCLLSCLGTCPDLRTSFARACLGGGGVLPSEAGREILLSGVTRTSSKHLSENCTDWSQIFLSFGKQSAHSCSPDERQAHHTELSCSCTQASVQNLMALTFNRTTDVLMMEVCVFVFGRCQG